MSSPSPQNIRITNQSFFSSIVQRVFFEASGWCSSIQHPLEDPGCCITPRKTNMEPENGPLKQEIPIGNHHFQVLCYISGEYTSFTPCAQKVALHSFTRTVSPYSCHRAPARRGVPHRSQSFATRRRWYRRAPLTSSAVVMSCWEDHPMTCKWLGSPPFISHEIRPFGMGIILLMGTYDLHGY